MIYNQFVRTQFMTPKHVGELPLAHNVYTVKLGLPNAEDRVQLQWQLDEKGFITVAKFLAQGQPYTIVACEEFSAWCEGRSVGALDGFDFNALAKHMGLPSAKRSCILLVSDACQQLFMQVKEAQHE